jgi:nicotinamidase-related amidase
MRLPVHFGLACFMTNVLVCGLVRTDEPPSLRKYSNQLIRIEHPVPLLADHPEFFEPIIEQVHFEAAAIVDEPDASLHVRAWRFSYNARGIIEMPNHLQAIKTAVIMVHPWGIDDPQGWITPQPAGVADFCTPEKNHLAARHTREIVRPFINRLRNQVGMVLYSLPGGRDAIRAKMYRSFAHKPSDSERKQGAQELAAKLKGFAYRGEALPVELNVSTSLPVRDYFRQFPGLDASAKFNNTGFWDLPIPVTADVDYDPNDIVIYDSEGYGPLKEFLQNNGIRHVLLTGYATDMCFCKTTAGFDNLSKDFNVFLVGDASLATFPANTSPRFAVNAAISFAALNHLITQVSWVKLGSEGTK